MEDDGSDAFVVLNERIAKLEKALKPFADLWAELELSSGTDDSQCEVYVRQGDLRMASVTLDDAA